MGISILKEPVEISIPLEGEDDLVDPKKFLKKEKKKKTKPKKKTIVSRMTGGQIIAAIYD